MGVYLRNFGFGLSALPPVSGLVIFGGIAFLLRSGRPVYTPRGLAT